MADGVLVIRQFWPFGVDDAIEVHDAKAGLGNFRGRDGQHFGRIAASVGWLGIRKQSADIWQGSAAEQCVGYCMQQHVGVAVTDKLSVMRYIDASEPQRTAGRGAVRVFAKSNPQIARGMNSQFGAGNILVDCPGSMDGWHAFTR
jgi:hypothetical protein